MLVLAVPSQPVGLEANYISSSELLVKWQLPLFPNGNITKYIVKYDFSTYSPWKQDLDWCIRQVFGNNPGGDKIEEGSTDKTPDGRCEENREGIRGKAPENVGGGMWNSS